MPSTDTVPSTVFATYARVRRETARRRSAPARPGPRPGVCSRFRTSNRLTLLLSGFATSSSESSALSASGWELVGPVKRGGGGGCWANTRSGRRVITANRVISVRYARQALLVTLRLRFALGKHNGSDSLQKAGFSHALGRSPTGNEALQLQSVFDRKSGLIVIEINVHRPQFALPRPNPVRPRA